MLVVLVALLVLVWIEHAPGPRVAGVLLAGLVVIAGLNVASTSTAATNLHRIDRPILGAVGERVLADPDMTAFFRRHGMPAPTPRVRADAVRLKGIDYGIPTDPETEVFLGWVHAHARTTWASICSPIHRAATLPLFTEHATLVDESPGYLPSGERTMLAARSS